jgi:hypothetical protein
VPPAGRPQLTRLAARSPRHVRLAAAGPAQQHLPLDGELLIGFGPLTGHFLDEGQDPVDWVLTFGNCGQGQGVGQTLTIGRTTRTAAPLRRVPNPTWSSVQVDTPELVPRLNIAGPPDRGFQ